MKKKEVKQLDDEALVIPRIEFKYAKIKLIGETPLLVQKFTEKAKKQMAEKHEKKAKGARDSRDKEQEFRDSLYQIDKKTYGIPAAGIKNCAVSACRFIEGISMTTAKGAFQVVDDLNGLVPLEGDAPVMDERIVRIGKFGNKVAMPRYRGRFDKWSVTFSVKYNSRIISAEQLANLYENAGFAIGLCEYRPEKSGHLGQFKVARK